ncbi:MAG: UDP-N-acetylmuramoyl-L-alanine--D-glutamate ligase [Bacteroidales bacterium]
MIALLDGKLRNKRVCILGFGREGQSTYSLIRKYFPDLPLTIADRDHAFLNSLALKEKDKNLRLISGTDYLREAGRHQLVFKTPGITMKSLSGMVPASSITSQADIFLEAYRKQVIGVTGTKGKTTTASLIYHILRQSGRDAVLIGNVGLPPFEMHEKIRTGTAIVYEMSSHQLETVNHSPHIAILLNLFEEHLDHYVDFYSYAMAKLNIMRYQQRGDVRIYSADHVTGRTVMADPGGATHDFTYSLLKKVTAGCYLYNGRIIFRRNRHESEMMDASEIPLMGNHNSGNVMAAMIAAHICRVSLPVIQKGVRSFRGLKHRLEFLGVFRGVEFYNDSIATIPQATMAALKTLGNVEILILGGYDRGIDYDCLVSFLQGFNVKNILLTGPAGKRIQIKLKQSRHPSNLFYRHAFTDIFPLLRKIAKAGDTCLLSPAAASYDCFKDFEERGILFAEFAQRFEAERK